MRSRLLSVLGLFALALGVACAQEDPSGPQPPRPTSPALTRPDMPPSGWLAALARAAEGERVLAVGYAPNDEFTAPEFAPRGGLKRRLEALTEAASTEDVRLEPTRVRDAWVIAPAAREEVRTKPGGRDLYDVGRRGLFLRFVLSTLNAEQARKLGSPDGIAVRELSSEARKALAAAFRPPLHLFEMRRVGVAPGAEPPEGATLVRGHGYYTESLGIRTKPIDWSKARLRARLRVNAVLVPVGSGGRETLFRWPGPIERTFLQPADPFSPVHLRSVQPDLTEWVPNTLKDSDLSGDGRSRSIGLSGTLPLADVVRQMGRVTGLALYASRPYTDLPVYIGDPELTTGAVLDGLALALTGAWRKVEDAYVLTWDREGLSGVVRRIEENYQPLENAAARLEKRSDAGEGWEHLASSLPFRADDPLALTNAQRRSLLDPTPDPQRWDRGVPWEDMTDNQRDAVRGLLDDYNQRPDIQSRPPDQRPVTEANLPRSSIDENLMMDLEMDVPGIGWVDIGNGTGATGLSWHDLDRARSERATARARDGKDVQTTSRRPSRPPDRSAVLNAETRAAMVPPLGREALADTLAAMKAHDLNTLFYPVLWNGFSTIASEAFPALPDTAGVGWAEAVAAAESAGIRTAGYLDTLTWQRAGSGDHWLSEHPEWVDVDMLGRPRLAWLREQTGDLEKRAAGRGLVANWVRPRAPEVARRLEALIQEFAGQPGAWGIAITEWRPGKPDLGRVALDAPPLGYAEPDRRAVLADKGVDPIDMGRPFVPRALAPAYSGVPGPFWPFQWERGEEPDPYRDLFRELVQAADAAKPGWTVYATDDAGSGLYEMRPLLRAVPELDMALVTAGSPLPDRMGMYVPVRPRLTGLEGQDPVDWAIGFTRYSGYGKELPAIVLDFRAAPELIGETLARVSPPDGNRRMPGFAPASVPAGPNARRPVRPNPSVMTVPPAPG